MSYDGHVVPGGPPQRQSLTGLDMAKLAVSSMDNNVYLLTCTATRRGVLVDAADDWPAIRRLIDEGDTTVETIVTTHRHWDHVRALREAVAATGARTVAGAPDAPHLPVPVDRPVEHGDRIRFGQAELVVVALRGHTPGSIALAYHEPGGPVHLLTGDSLFPGGVGATNHHDDQSFSQLIDDVEHRVFDVYGDDTRVYPGHGDDTTLGAERPSLPQWRKRGW